jgi:hypothetical protein
VKLTASEVGMKGGVTLGQLKHGCAVEELGDADVLQETLSATGLHHELTGERGDRARLKWSEDDGFVEGVPGHHIPVGEMREDHGLTDSVCPEICFKAEGFDGRDFHFQ